MTPAPNDVAGRRENALIAAFYLGWLGQAFALQHLYDYVHAPGILLAILVCASVAGRWPQLHPAARVGLAVFASLALLCSPALSSSRLGCWVQCLPLKSSPEIRDKLKLMQFPDWQELNRVAAFLRACQVRDGDVCCFPNSTIHLYEMLGIRPPTRHVYIENTLVFFPARRELLRTALEAAAPRYAVTDLATAGVPPDVLHRVGPGSIMSGQRADASPAGRVFPWGFPIVFRAGRYAVHQVRKPILSLEVTP